MTGSIDVDVLVVGGGLTGMSLACALASADVSVALVDRVDPSVLIAPNYDGRTTAIAAGSQHILEAIGVWPKVAADACPINDIRISDSRVGNRASPLFLHFDHREVGDEPMGHIVENRLLRAALLWRSGSLGALTIRAPAQIAETIHRSGSLQIGLDDGTRIRCRLIAGCDGRNSLQRRQAGIPVTEWRYDQMSIVCTAGHARPHRNIAHERFLPSGPFAILPLNDDGDGRHRSSIVWTEDKRLVPGFMALDDQAFANALADRFGDFMGEVDLIGPRWSHPLGLMHAARYTAKRLALVGDAAHVIHPIAGQGLNLGWRDVAVLSEVLVDAKRLGLDIGVGSVLARYERWRRFDNTTLAVATDALNRLFSNDIGPLRLARDIGLATVGRLPRLRQLFMRHAMGMVGELPRLVRGEPL